MKRIFSLLTASSAVSAAVLTKPNNSNNSKGAVVADELNAAISLLSETETPEVKTSVKKVEEKKKAAKKLALFAKHAENLKINLKQTPAAKAPAAPAAAAKATAAVAADAKPSPTDSTSDSISMNLRQRIAQDSKHLGKAAENLLSVQADINRVEEEVQGKVFDLESVRNFFATHQAINAENDELKKRNNELNFQLADLGNQLANSQSNHNSNLVKYTNAVQTRDAKIAELESVIKGLNIELEKRMGDKLKNVELTKLNAQANQHLKAQANEVAFHKNQVVEAKAQINKLMTDNNGLTQQLAAERNVNKQLVTTVNQLKTQNDALVKKEWSQDQKAVAVENERSKTAAISEHRLMTEIGLLKTTVAQRDAEIVKHKATIVDWKNRNAVCQSLFEQTKAAATNQLESLKSQLGQYRDHILSLRESVSQNVIARKNCEKNAEKLEQMLINSNVKVLENQVKLQKNANKLLQDNFATAQINLSKATSDLNTESLARQAAEKTSELNLASAKKAQIDAQTQVTKVTAEAKAEIDVANNKIMLAESALASKCTVAWDRKNKKVKKKLRQCKVVKENLGICKTEKKTLTESLKSFQACAKK